MPSGDPPIFRFNQGLGGADNTPLLLNLNAPSTISIQNFHEETRRFQQHARETAISSALTTDEGRVALAVAMVEPIRRQLDYAGIGRRLLTVDPLPQDALAHYGMIKNPTKKVTKKRQWIADSVQYGLRWDDI